jgi:4-hydroxybenzoate polyprenyltransferase
VSDDPKNRSTFHSYIELMRLPNVFTSVADVAMGFLFVQPSDWRWNVGRDSWPLALLITASSLLYIAGIVLNDVFDLEIDRRQRPERPLPSGRVSLPAARLLGWLLLALGVASGVGAGLFVGHPWPGVIAGLLAACIVLYDAWLKRTPLGPLAMGSCRTFNVLLGMSALGVPWHTEHYLVAGGIGVYVAGVTWFARKEAQRSSRLQLTLATLVMALGIAMLIGLPQWSDRTVVGTSANQGQWYLWTSVLGMAIISRSLRAIISPVPTRVQTAVAVGILSIVVLDAFVCFAIGRVCEAGLILLLLLPAMFLGRWIKMT